MGSVINGRNFVFPKWRVDDSLELTEGAGQALSIVGLIDLAIRS